MSGRHFLGFQRTGGRRSWGPGPGTPRNEVVSWSFRRIRNGHICRCDPRLSGPYPPALRSARNRSSFHSEPRRCSHRVYTSSLSSFPFSTELSIPREAPFQSHMRAFSPGRADSG